MKQNTWISCAKGVEIEIERIRKEEWVLVDIEGIRTTAKHSCNRKVCIGRKNGYDYTVIEAQPCYRYMELDEKYKKAHRYCKKFIHRLPFTPFSQKAKSPKMHSKSTGVLFRDEVNKRSSWKKIKMK